METTVPQMVNRLTLGFRSEWSTFRGLFIIMDYTGIIPSRGAKDMLHLWLTLQFTR